MDGFAGNSGRMKRTTRRRRPSVEGFESRLLLSAAGIARGLAVPTQTRAESAAGFPQSGGILGEPLSTNVDPTVIASGVGVPTRHEAARNAFSAKFSGTFDSVGGRTSELAATTLIRGKGAWTNILKGSTQGVISTPLPSSTAPGYASGIVELIPKSSSVVGQLNIRVQGEVGATNLPTPTKLTWVVDPSSSGVYTNAVGQGTIELKYFTQGRRNGHITGTARMIVTGTLIRSGLPF